MEDLLVSLCTIAYNEESVLPNLLNQFRQQSYDHKRTQIVLVDSASTDQTKQLFLEFAQQYQQEYHSILVLDNPKKIQSAGWNVAIKKSCGDAVIRVDAHGEIAKDFVENNVACLSSGEDVCGGIRPNIMVEDTPYKRTLLMAESSMFGSSVADYRREGEKKYVNSLFHGCYRREVLDAVGGFDEMLGRTEDNEIHWRIRQAGYKICMDPQIVSYQHTRSDLKRMLKQKYGNGYWIGLTLGVCPGCVSIYHFVPFLFVCGIVFSTLLGALFSPLFPALFWGAYGLAAVVMSLVSFAAQPKKHPIMLILPVLFLMLHVSYGVGTLLGLLNMPSFVKTYQKNKKSAQ